MDISNSGVKLSRTEALVLVAAADIIQELVDNDAKLFAYEQDMAVYLRRLAKMTPVPVI